MDIRKLDGPTLIQVTAPWCAHCRSMSGDMSDLGVEFQGRVSLIAVDVSASPESAASLGVKGTPTLIGVAGGTEVFSHIGRRTRDQLAEMFKALENGDGLSTQRSGDTGLTIVAGSILALVGVVSGPAWSLLYIGIAVLGFGLVIALRASDA